MRVGARPADLRPQVRARRLPTLEPELAGTGNRWVALARRLALLLVSLGGIALAWLALQKIGIGNIVSALVNSSPTFVLLGLAVMCSAMAMRAVSWHAILQAALPRARIRLGDAMQGTFIGVLMSSTLPARLGEPSRALVVARRSGRPRENLPIVLGTLVSQTLLNILALADPRHGHVLLGRHLQRPSDGAAGHGGRAAGAAGDRAGGPGDPSRRRRARPGSRFTRAHEAVARARRALTRVRAGLVVFRRPKLGAIATLAQLAAWGLQWFSCYLLLVALGLDQQAGIGAAAAVLFAVNITAVLPGDPGEPRRVPGGLRRGPAHRLARRHPVRRRLRRDPPGRGGRDRDPDGDAGPAQGGDVLARGPAAGDARHAGEAARRGRTSRSAGRGGESAGTQR